MRSGAQGQVTAASRAISAIRPIWGSSLLHVTFIPVARLGTARLLPWRAIPVRPAGGRHLLCAPKANRPGARRASIVAPGGSGTLKPARRGGAKMREVVILIAVRTPIGRFLGGTSPRPGP